MFAYGSGPFKRRGPPALRRALPLRPMPPRDVARAESPTRLARARAARGVTQADLADAIGISIATYQRLEGGRMANPPIRYLANAAIALGRRLADVCEPEWLAWSPLGDPPRRAPRTPLGTPPARRPRRRR